MSCSKAGFDAGLHIAGYSPLTGRRYLLLLALILLVALFVQLDFFEAGLFRITSDESARILTVWHLTTSNALEPLFWPPFYKLFVGASLKPYPAIFTMPRVLVCVMGLLSLLALAKLATALFQDPRISLITAMLAVLAPHRLIFSVVPPSDIYYFLFMILAAALGAQWLRTDRTRLLILSCLCLLLAESVRFESGLLSVFMETLLLFRYFFRRNLAFTTLCVASLTLFIFPVFWVLNSYLWYGSLKNLGITSQQFIGVLGRNYWVAIKWMPLRFFIQDILWNPLTLPGPALLAWLSLRDASIRTWALLFGLPLLVLSAFMVITLSVPMAATWRTSGFWSLVTLPFDAWIVLRIVVSLTSIVRLSRPILGTLLLLAILPMGIRSVWYARDDLRNNESHAMHQERALDRFLDARLAGLPGGIAVIDSFNNLDYMDVLAFSSASDRLLLTAKGNPVLIGIYVPRRAAYEGKPDIASLLTDQFSLDHGGNANAFAAKHLRFVVVRNPSFITALDKSSLVAQVKQFSGWTVYSINSERAPISKAAGPARRSKHVG